jgi:hypothetical protein
MRLIALMLVAVLLGAVAGEAKQETVQFRGYNITFDLGNIPYNVKYVYTDDRLLYIDINDPQTINITKFDGADQVIPQVDDVSIYISFGSRNRTSSYYSGNISWSRKMEKTHRLEYENSGPPDLDNLSKSVLNGGRDWEQPQQKSAYWERLHQKFVYKTIQIDGKPGRIIAPVDSGSVCAIYYVTPPYYAQISAGFDGTHFDLDSSSSEEIQFKISYLENFLKTLHIERVGRVPSSAPVRSLF